MIVITYPGCNRNVREAVAALEEANLLRALHTTLSFKPDDFVLKLLPARLRNELLRREFPCPAEKIFRHGSLELLRIVANRTKLERLTRQEGPLGPTTVGIALDKHAADYIRKNADTISGVFGYEDSCLFSFRAAQDLNKKRIYELTTPYWQKTLQICSAEAERYPQWKSTIDSIDTTELVRQRKTEEAKSADTILCISKFVHDSLPKEVQHKATIVQYGFPSSPFSQDPSETRQGNIMRVLFVGYLSQRKGLADLFAAFKLMKRSDVQLVVLGKRLASMEFYRSEYADFEYHEPLPNHQVLEFMRSCDVLAFPAICEGRGLVQLEAMSCGLPVIGTVGATTDDLVDDGVEGFVVPVGSPQALAEKISWFADHPQERRAMGERALARAKTISWNLYRDQVVNAVLRES